MSLSFNSYNFWNKNRKKFPPLYLLHLLVCCLINYYNYYIINLHLVIITNDIKLQVLIFISLYKNIFVLLAIYIMWKKFAIFWLKLFKYIVTFIKNNYLIIKN
jgi:hypothetical protein